MKFLLVIILLLGGLYYLGEKGYLTGIPGTGQSISSVSSPAHPLLNRKSNGIVVPITKDDVSKADVYDLRQMIESKEENVRILHSLIRNYTKPVSFDGGRPINRTELEKTVDVFESDIRLMKAELARR